MLKQIAQRAMKMNCQKADNDTCGLLSALCDGDWLALLTPFNIFRRDRDFAGVEDLTHIGIDCGKQRLRTHVKVETACGRLLSIGARCVRWPSITRPTTSS